MFNEDFLHNFLFWKEFGCPHEILTNNPNGHFSQMVDQTGFKMSNKLKELARKSYVKNLKKQMMINKRQRSLELFEDSEDGNDVIHIF